MVSMDRYNQWHHFESGTFPNNHPNIPNNIKHKHHIYEESEWQKVPQTQRQEKAQPYPTRTGKGGNDKKNLREYLARGSAQTTY